MNNTEKEIDMGFTKERFPDCNHLCLIYDDEEQRRKIVSKYVSAGLTQGELVRYVTDMTAPEKIRSWVLEMGVELPEIEKNEPFGIFQAESWYCPSGRFDPQKLIDGMVPRYHQVEQAGYKGSRVCGEMTWALRDLPGSDRLLEYEVLLNTVTEAFPHVGMCMYDANLFDGATLFKVLQVHPYMVAQGHVVRNPFYLRPEEF
jgi:hypothetical protein